LIEHLSCGTGFLALLRECRRVLGENGVLRIATPDLQALSPRTTATARPGLGALARSRVDRLGPARMLNQAFRGWGHQHLYDEQELTLRLSTAGFAEIRREAIGESTHREARRSGDARRQQADPRGTRQAGDHPMIPITPPELPTAAGLRAPARADLVDAHAVELRRFLAAARTPDAGLPEGRHARRRQRRRSGS
jgi:hypothetical protein